MGESFGDFDGAEYLNEYRFVPVSGENPFSVGAYATGNKDRAIRSYGMNFPARELPTPGVSLVKSGGPLVNPLNFSNHGFDITGAQVHADGEIWSAVNYDIRQALVSKYNATYPGSNALLQRQCADGLRTPDTCPGNRRWIQIVYDAMVLMPTAPSMLDARNAYFAADAMRQASSVNWPSNQTDSGSRLLGADSAIGGEQQPARTKNDTDPTPNFESPNQGETAVTFVARAMNEGNAVIPNARIFVGHYEARVSPIADTNPQRSRRRPAAPGNNLDNVARFVAGHLRVHGAGRWLRVRSLQPGALG